MRMAQTTTTKDQAARYVILRHQTPPGYKRPLHWDLMLEQNGALQTWALTAEPVAGASIEAAQLADHRLTYLDYEGEVSGGRGSVSRVDAGRFVWLMQRGNLLQVELSGGQLQGIVTLQQTGGTWRVNFAPQANTKSPAAV